MSAPLPKPYSLPQGTDLCAFLGDLLLQHDPESLPRIAVIFPGERPGIFLRKALAQAFKRPFLPPAIFSLERFLKTLYLKELEPSAQEVSRYEEMGILVNLLQEQGFQASELTSHLTLLGEIVAFFEELRMNQVPEEQGFSELVLRGVPADLKIGGWLPLPSVLKLYPRYYRELHHRNRFSRALLYEKIRERFSELKFLGLEQLIFAGFIAEDPGEDDDAPSSSFLPRALTKGERLLFQRFFEEPRTLWILEQDPGFSGVVEIFQKRKASQEEPISLELLPAKDPHHLLLGVREFLTSLPEEERFSPGTALIVLDPRSLLPVMNLLLEGAREDQYNIALPYPLHLTPLGRFLELLCTMASWLEETEKGTLKLPRQDLLNLLQHPYTRALFEAFARHNPSLPPFPLISTLRDTFFAEPWVELSLLPHEAAPLPEDEKGKLAQALLPLHQRLLSPLVKAETIGMFASHLRVILSELEGIQSQEPLFPAVRNELLIALEELEASGLSPLPLTPKELLPLYHSLLRSRSLHFPGTPLQGLQVLGFLEARNLSFKNLIFLHAEEGIFPQPQGSSIPRGVRESLGLPQEEERDRLYAGYFLGALARARRVLLGFCEDLKGKERSRFLHRLSWEQERRTGGQVSLKERSAVSFPYLTSPRVPEPVAKDEETLALLRSMVYSYKSLETFLNCPLRFYYQYVVKLPGDPEKTPNMVIGSAIHGILHRYFQALPSGMPLKSEDLDPVRMEQCVEHYLNQRLHESGSPPSLRSERIVQVLKEHLSGYLESFEKPLLDAYGKQQCTIQILALEEECPPVKILSYPIQGRFDRIETRGEEIWVIDYKFWDKDRGRTRSGFDSVGAGKVNKNELPEFLEELAKAVPALQLILYGLLIRHQHPGKTVVPAFRCLGERFSPDSPSWKEYEFPLRRKEGIDTKSKGEKGKNEGVFEVDPQALEELFQDGARVVELLLELIVQEDLPFTPPRDPLRSCPRCPYTALCKTTWTKQYTP